MTARDDLAAIIGRNIPDGSDLKAADEVLAYLSRNGWVPPRAGENTTAPGRYPPIVVRDQDLELIRDVQPITYADLLDADPRTYAESPAPCDSRLTCPHGWANCPPNEAGDVRCPNDGERVNRKCWKCGTPRRAESPAQPAEPMPGVTAAITTAMQQEWDDRPDVIGATVRSYNRRHGIGDKHGYLLPHNTVTTTSYDDLPAETVVCAWCGRSSNLDRDDCPGPPS